MIYENRRFRFVNNAVSFTTFRLDAKGRTGSNVTTFGQLAIDITSLGITPEEFEDKYLTFRE